MTRTMRKRAGIALAGILFLAGPALSGLDVRAVRVASGPKIDGLLDDPAWTDADASADFRMVFPVSGGEPSEKTVLRIVYDEANLYLGILCRDGEPGRISANTMAHDQTGFSGGYGGYGHFGASSSASDDQVKILLDPFQDKRTAYVFFVNPRGARGEGLIYDGNASLNWDGIWDAAARVTEDGWSAEFRIPFKSISFKPGLSVWGLNVERFIARKLETIRLSGLSRDSNFNKPSEAASLTGIENIRQGKGITIRPYGLSAVEKVHQPGAPAEFKLDGGLDVYKSFTPNLVGVASVNMDFAETEADERRINLTRFQINYDDVSRNLGWSARIRWRISPGNEIYLVFNKGWERSWDPVSRFLPTEERGVLKLSFSIRP